MARPSRSRLSASVDWGTSPMLGPAPPRAPVASGAAARSGDCASVSRRTVAQRTGEDRACTSSSWAAAGSARRWPTSWRTQGHTVAVIDSNESAFRRLGAGVHRPPGHRHRLRPGHPARGRHRGGATPSPRSAAATTPTSSPPGWPARRSASSNVVARIYDPGRAEVYQRLGIPTVATVPLDRRPDAAPAAARTAPSREWRDPSGTVRLAEVTVDQAWVGAADQPARGGVRRPGRVPRPGSARACCPAAETVLQEGDLVHVVMRDERRRRASTPCFATGPRGALMRVAIAGAGSRRAARSPASCWRTGTRCCSSTRTPPPSSASAVPDAEWLLADACEVTSLEEAGAARAATW